MRIPAILALLSLSSHVISGEADILAAEAEHIGGDFYRFNVTVEHNDESWDHYAKAWEVIGPDGEILGVRVLRHPHIKEQPFTRSQIVTIPPHIDHVTIRAYDLVHKYGGKELTLKLNKEKQDEIK